MFSFGEGFFVFFGKFLDFFLLLVFDVFFCIFELFFFIEEKLIGKEFGFVFLLILLRCFFVDFIDIMFLLVVCFDRFFFMVFVII